MAATWVRGVDAHLSDCETADHLSWAAASHCVVRVIASSQEVPQGFVATVNEQKRRIATNLPLDCEEAKPDWLVQKAGLRWETGDIFVVAQAADGSASYELVVPSVTGDCAAGGEVHVAFDNFASQEGKLRCAVEKIRRGGLVKQRREGKSRHGTRSRPPVQLRVPPGTP